jgi:hypothetical protein
MLCDRFPTDENADNPLAVPANKADVTSLMHLFHQYRHRLDLTVLVFPEEASFSPRSGIVDHFRLH